MKMNKVAQCLSLARLLAERPPCLVVVRTPTDPTVTDDRHGELPPPISCLQAAHKGLTLAGLRRSPVAAGSVGVETT